ncbi:MAG TPA: hypothetical protein VF894_10630, partial [Anaeromyxobacter sp.]
MSPLDERAHRLDDAPQEHRRGAQPPVEGLPFGPEPAKERLARRPVAEERRREGRRILERHLVPEGEVD